MSSTFCASVLSARAITIASVMCPSSVVVAVSKITCGAWPFPATITPTFILRKRGESTCVPPFCSKRRKRLALCNPSGICAKTGLPVCWRRSCGCNTPLRVKCRIVTNMSPSRPPTALATTTIKTLRGPTYCPAVAGATMRLSGYSNPRCTRVSCNRARNDWYRTSVASASRCICCSATKPVDCAANCPSNLARRASISPICARSCATSATSRTDAFVVSSNVASVVAARARSSSMAKTAALRVSRPVSCWIWTVAIRSVTAISWRSSCARNVSTRWVSHVIAASAAASLASICAPR